MKKRQKVLFTLGSLLLLSLVYLSGLFYSHYNTIREYPVTAWLEDHRADCGVVLTGGPNRIQDALEQLYLKRIKKLIISGVNPATQLRDIFPEKPFYGDLDGDDIILEKRSLTTFGNAQQALPLIEALNCKDFVLMTSKLHMFRAFNTFRNHFPAEIPIYRRSTLGKRHSARSSRLGAEAFKTVFYDLWFF